MSLLVRGSSHCVACGLVIGDEDEVIMLPHFVRNRNSDLYRFSDGNLHARCVNDSSVALKAVRLAEETILRLGPGQRSCEVCSEEIRDPDDYVTLGFVTDAVESVGAWLNWLQFHRTHLHLWDRLEGAIESLERLALDDGWCMEDITELAEELRRYAW